MSRFILPRRTVLRGLFGGTALSLGLPPLEAMFNVNGNAYADGGALPKRFGMFFWGNGNRPEKWTPLASGSTWDLSESLLPLAAVKSHLTVVSGLEVKLVNDAPHGTGAAGILTAAPLDLQGNFTAASIDQVIAQEVGNDTLYRSLETGIDTATGRSYNGPNSKNPTETSPHTLFARIFGDTFREPGDLTIDPKLALRRSVLDAVMNDTTALQNRVGANDKIRLEQHLEGIRDLELRLVRLEEDPPALEACLLPTEPDADYPYIDGRPQLALTNSVMADLIAMAFACDQTRVISHWFSDPVSDTLYPDATAGHHDLTHNESGKQSGVQAITVQCMEAYAAVLAAMAAIPEGAGTLLDNSVVMACSEVSLGQTHAISDMPVLLAGSACGVLKTDYHYASAGQESTSKLLLTLLQAMDISASSHGVGACFADTTLSDLFV